jgi:hypothetical protein
MGLHAMYDAHRNGRNVYVRPDLWVVDYRTPDGIVDHYETTGRESAEAEAEQLRQYGCTEIVIRKYGSLKL